MATIPTSGEDIAQSTTAIEGLETSLSIADFKNNTPLWYKIHVFIYDLLNFRQIPEAQARLDQIIDASYMGSPYFKPGEVKMLKGTIMDGEKTLEAVIEKTLNERLQRRMKKRIESESYCVCAAHDLAPIFEKAFNIKPKELAKNQEVLAIVGRSGLGLEGDEKRKDLSKKIFPEK